VAGIGQDLAEDDRQVGHAKAAAGLHELPPRRLRNSARVSRAGAVHDTAPITRASVWMSDPNTTTSTSSRMKLGTIWNASVMRIRSVSTQPA